MEQHEDRDHAEDSAWAQAGLRVVLATNSPFVAGFFTNLARERMGFIAIHVLAVAASALVDHVRYLEDAAVAVAHSDPDFPAAQALSAALGISWPGLPMIALVSSVRAITPWYVSTMLRAELSGLLDLEASATEVVSVLEAVAHGRVGVALARDRVHAAALADALLRPEPTVAAPILPSLTGRERDVLELLRNGGSDKEIAVRLGMSPSTVGNHVRSIQTRLGARTRVELGVLIGRLEGRSR